MGDLHTSEMWRCTDFVTSELGDPNFSVCVSVLLITPRNIIVFYSHSDSLVIRVCILSPQSPQICGDELKNSKIMKMRVAKIENISQYLHTPKFTNLDF